jgi:hypothetical protein
MSGPHPLNQAVIAQALYDLRNGQLRRAKSMGFDDQDLDALKHPAAVSILTNATVSWCSVTINQEVIHHLLHQVTALEQEVEDIDRLLRLGASTELITRFYGLTHQEIALRRNVIGLPKRKGRHPVLSSEESAELWRGCTAHLQHSGMDTADERALLMMAADMAEDMNLPVSVIWGTIVDWVGNKRL